MNSEEAPIDDAEVLRLLRERDSLGAESSLWLRAIRKLTSDGKPVGQFVVLTIPVGDGRQMPIGMMSLTEKQRLVFWPVLPRRKSAIINKPNASVPDHITVDFPGEKLHVTGYESDGTAWHAGDGWRSQPVGAAGLRLLFVFQVRMSVLVDQDVLVTRKFQTPPTDNERRTAEFQRTAGNFIMCDLGISGDPSKQQHVALAVYGAPPVISPEMLQPRMLPISGTDGTADEWPADSQYEIIVRQVLIRDQSLCVAAGFPPGRLIDDLCFGLPHRGPARKDAG